MTEYYLPTGYGTSEFVEKKSRFIGEVWRISTEEEARQRVAEVKKKYHDARHSCWCYLLRDGTVRYSDDGEPQGTAGQPMLEVFSREGITDCVCIVTRYFGGILLGTGGLARAYTKGAKDALLAAGVTVERLWDRILVPCSYAQFERVRQETEKHGGYRLRRGRDAHRSDSRGRNGRIPGGPDRAVGWQHRRGKAGSGIPRRSGTVAGAFIRPNSRRAKSLLHN